jgi:hypothetical protein
MAKDGICALCRQEAELQLSHLIPRAVYLDLRTPELPNPNPIFSFPEGESGPRQEQVVAPLLCRSCEHRFSVNGEKWVLENGYRLKGPSRLYQTLKNAEPLPEHSSGTVYAGADLPALDMDKLAYFGASVFWRASNAVWPVVEKWHKRKRFLDLGRYAEPLRQFLLGEGEFPPEMVLKSAVVRSSEPPPVIGFPSGLLTSKGGATFHMHTFHIPGLSFLLSVGRRIPKSDREFCVIRSTRRILFFSPIEDVINRMAAKTISESLPSASMRKLHRKVAGEEL